MHILIKDQLKLIFFKQNKKFYLHRTKFLIGGLDGTRTRDLRRDRAAF